MRASQAGTSRRSRFSREPRQALRLRSRDFQLLEDLYLHRAMSRNQIIALGYFDSVFRCNARLRQLFDHGLVRRGFSPLGPYGSQAIYSIDRAGAFALCTHKGLDGNELLKRCRKDAPTMWLEHTLRIVDVRIAIMTAVKGGGGIEVDAWLPELSCRHEYLIRHSPDEPWQRHVLKPDGFVGFRTNGPGLRSGNFFIEVDLGHVSWGQFANKVRAYREYLDHGVFREAYREDAFRVLTITTGKRRLMNLRKAAAHGRPDIFFFTTFELLRRGLFAPIWESGAGDVRRSLLTDHRAAEMKGESR